MNTKQGILFIEIAFLIFCAFVGTVSAADIYVPDNYTKIQWAVDNATEGDTIIVRDGTYTENVDVNKSLTIALAHNPTVTEFPICTDPAGQANPAISGDIVVWTDYRNGNADIYGYDLSTNTEFPICTDPAGQANPAISGNIVVWRDDRNYYSTGLDIYGYDLSTDAEFPICTNGAWQQHPAISGDIVVWMDKRNGNQDIYGYNLSSQEELEVYTEPTWQGYPAISGNIVVWWDCVLVDHSLTSCDIYGYDLSTGTECAICTHPSYQYHPAISGDIVVWMDSRGVDIYGYNLSTDTEFPICTDPAGQNVPAISGNIVVWTDFRNYYSTGIDIYGYDLSTDAEFPICTDLAGQHCPAISGDIVVWMDDRGGNSDIYGARLALPQFKVCEVSNPAGAYICSDSVSIAFERDLGLGDEGEDVRYLQAVLNANPVTQVAVEGPGSPCHETDYFGELTKAAVIKFQTLHGLTQSGEVDSATRVELNKLSLPVKHVPNGWVLNVTNTHQNNEIRDGCVWWEVEDVTDGVKGWVAYQKISDGTTYLNTGNQEELKSRINKLNTKTERIPVILQEVTGHYAEFLPANFPPELILAMAIQESGGEGFDNEIVALTPWGRGIMQIDTPDYFVGMGSEIRWYNNGAVDYCRGEEGHGCTCNGEICYCEACKHYYTNTTQGIEANIKDGLNALQDRHHQSNCQFYNTSCKGKEGTEFTINYPDSGATLKGVCGIPEGESPNCCKRKWNDEKKRWDCIQDCNAKITEIKIGDIIIQCEEFRIIDGIWRYNGRSIYDITKEPDKVCMGNDYLRCIANKIDETDDSSNEIVDIFGCKMPNKDEWIKKFNYVRNTASIMYKIKSPGCIQIYDSMGQVIGLINGEIREEIPFSSYDEATKTIIIPFSYDFYRYEVVGTATGTYGLTITSVEDGNATTFTATDIPTAAGAVHQYTIDWAALSQGEEGVTVQIDSDGDGVFEDAFTADGELTYDEFMLQTATIIDFDPDTLNLQSEGKWVTVYTELPAGYNVTDINVSTMLLNETVPAELQPTEVGDYDFDGVPDLMVKFDRQAVIDILPIGDAVSITVTGNLYDGAPFEGSDVIRVIDQS